MYCQRKFFTAVTIYLGILLFILTPVTGLAVPYALNPTVSEMIAEADGADFLPVVVVMYDQADHQEIRAKFRGMHRRERTAFVWQELVDFSARSQADILEYLEREQDNGRVLEYRSIRVINGIALEAHPAVIQTISERADVRVIIDDLYQETVPEPVESPVSELDETTWSIDFVHAPQAWAMGYTGEGVVVAVFDTGVNYNHLDLADHMWDGGEAYPYHGWNYVSNNNNPIDTQGHGTACAGHVAGDGTASDDTVGVAPDATIMAIRAEGTRAGFLSGLDFVLENGADVISTSLAFYGDNNNHSVRAIWRDAFDTMNLAGVITAKSAGNRGTSSPPYDQLSTPSGVPSPWRHPDEVEEGGRSGLISCGSVDQNYNRPSHSSTGPTSWEQAPDYMDWLYSGNDHVGMIFPDVCAPDGNGHTLNYASNTGYIYDFAGTSMATPHVGGVLALMLSKDIDLTPEEVDSILQTTAMDLGTAGKDNIHGAGLVQADAALAAIVLAYGTVNGTVTEVNTGLPMEGVPVVIAGRRAVIDTTDAEGFFEETVGIGNYSVWVDYPPYTFVEIQDVQVDSADTSEVEILMTVGELTWSPDSLQASLTGSDTITTGELWFHNIGSAPLEMELDILPVINTDDYLDLMFSFEVESQVDDNRINGIVYGDSTFYIAAANRTSNPNYIYKFNVGGEYIGSIIQPGSEEPDASSGGMIDITWDGTYLYGSYARDILVFDPETGELIRTIDGPLNTTRAITYDPDRNVLWTATYYYDIIGIDPETGEELFEIPADMRIHGMTYNPEDEDDLPLYLLIQETSGTATRREFYKANPETGEIVYVMSLPMREEIPDENPAYNGITFIQGWNSYYTVLAGTYDDPELGWMVVGWEFGVYVGWASLSQDEFIIPEYDSSSVDVTFLGSGLINGSYRGYIRARHNSLAAESEVPIELIVDIIDVDEDRTVELPEEYALEPPYPNPFNSTATIRFSLPEAASVDLVLYDILGREVVSLQRGELASGHYVKQINAERLSSGLYFLRMRAPGFEQTRKIVLMK